MARASRTSQARAARQAKMLYDMCAMAIVAGRADLDGADEVGFDIELPMFTVGRAGRTRQRASADAPPIRSFGAGGAATHGRWRSPVFAARHLAPCESAAAESGRRHQPGWHRADPFLGRGEPRAAPASRAIAPAGRFQRVRGRCGRWHCGNRTFPPRSHVASADSGRRRQLPSRESVEAARVEADVYDTRGGGVAGENEGIERGKPVSQPISRSIVLWGID